MILANNIVIKSPHFEKRHSGGSGTSFLMNLRYLQSRIQSQIHFPFRFPEYEISDLIDDLKLISVSFLWSQTNSEKLNVTLNEVANFQNDTWILNGNDFDIDFRRVFKSLRYAIRRCQWRRCKKWLLFKVDDAEIFILTNFR